MALLVAACAGGDGDKRPTITSTPATSTPVSVPPTATAIPTPTPAPTPTPDPASTLMWHSIAFLIEDEDRDFLNKIVATGDPRLALVLLEIYLHPDTFQPFAVFQIAQAMRDLTGQHYAGEQFREWIKWAGSAEDLEAPAGFDAWKGELLRRIDPSLGSFLYQDLPHRIRLEEIMWGGVGKDGIPDLRQPPHVPADQASYLNPSDRVFGVSINGAHRAYPLRILNAHEMANDTLGGEPFALAY